MRAQSTHRISGLVPFAAAGLLCSAFSAWGAIDLPPGEGREIVAQKCSLCHSLEARVGSGYTQEGWNTVLRMMVNHGAPLTPAEVAQIAPYLAKNFPEKGKSQGVVI